MGVGIAGMSLFTIALIVANVGGSSDAPKKPDAALLVGPGSIGVAGHF